MHTLSIVTWKQKTGHLNFICINTTEIYFVKYKSQLFFNPPCVMESSFICKDFNSDSAYVKTILCYTHCPLGNAVYSMRYLITSQKCYNKPTLASNNLALSRCPWWNDTIPCSKCNLINSAFSVPVPPWNKIQHWFKLSVNNIIQTHALFYKLLFHRFKILTF